MKKVVISLFFLASLSCIAQTQSKSNYVPGELLVQYQYGLQEADIELQILPLLEKELGAQSVLDVSTLHTDDFIQKIKLVDDQAMQRALEILNKNASVIVAEPNYIYHTFEKKSEKVAIESASQGESSMKLAHESQGAPNDEFFQKLWGLNNFGQLDRDQNGQNGKKGSDIHVMQVWEKGFLGNKKVVVAVIDTGINWTHPDLQANLYTNPGESGNGRENNNIDDDGNGYIDDVHGWNFITKNNQSQDDEGHGSHCAGTIGAVGNNNIGVVGINWNVSLMPVKFLDGDGGGSLDGAIEAIDYARKMKVDVMSNSWGGNQYSYLLDAAVGKTKDAGILFIAAAGNDSQDGDTFSTYPGSFKYDNVIAVAATDNKDKLADFSNFGKKTVHVAAPGVWIYSTDLGNGYSLKRGTSMATPHVAGAAALLKSAHPEWDYREIKKRLIESSDPLWKLKDKTVSSGRINVYNALMGIVPPVVDPEKLAPQKTSYVLESEHPYADKLDKNYIIQQPGAKYIRVHFEKTDFEKDVDRLNVMDADHEVVASLTGKNDGYLTPFVEGDSVILNLKSDFSNNAYGFKVDYIDVVY